MKGILLIILLLSQSLAFAEPETDSLRTESCRYWLSLFKPVCQRLRSIWTEGHNELYVSGYAWHNRYTYSRERIRQYNELAWGGGVGRGLWDEDGDWHGLYAIAFLDSHKNVEPAAGYAFLKTKHFSNDFSAGLGYTVLVTARPDIFKGVPFPGALPWAGVTWKKTSVFATYIPGASGAGNVLYILAKRTF